MGIWVVQESERGKSLGMGGDISTGAWNGTGAWKDAITWEGQELWKGYAPGRVQEPGMQALEKGHGPVKNLQCLGDVTKSIDEIEAAATRFLLAVYGMPQCQNLTEYSHGRNWEEISSNHPNLSPSHYPGSLPRECQTGSFSHSYHEV